MAPKAAPGAERGPPRGTVGPDGARRAWVGGWTMARIRARAARVAGAALPAAALAGCGAAHPGGGAVPCVQGQAASGPVLTAQQMPTWPEVEHVPHAAHRHAGCGASRGLQATSPFGPWRAVFSQCPP